MLLLSEKEILKVSIHNICKVPTLCSNMTNN